GFWHRHQLDLSAVDSLTVNKMALTIIGNLANLQRGVELPETGIGCRNFEVRTFPAVQEDHTDNLGEVDGRVVSTVPSIEVTIEGEVTGATGVMAFDFLTDCTIANDIDIFGGVDRPIVCTGGDKNTSSRWLANGSSATSCASKSCRFMKSKQERLQAKIER